ncbi:MAG: 3-hydroxyacyl-ACP dehydratase FabZ family protein [Thermoguttaceae bacterium]
MRWFWIDRITKFVSGKSAEAIKAISLAEDHLHDHYVGYPVMPASLVVEGLAQTAGMLVLEAGGYQKKVVLAKIPKIMFHEVSFRPGDCLTYVATINALREDGAMADVKAFLDGKLVVEGELVFAHLSDTFFGGTELFEDGDLVRMMNAFRAYEVAVDAGGNRITPPT